MMEFLIRVSSFPEIVCDVQGQKWASLLCVKVVCEGSVNATVELGNCFFASVTDVRVWDKRASKTLANWFV